jgi:hypothetical protein
VIGALLPQAAQKEIGNYFMPEHIPTKGSGRGGGRGYRNNNKKSKDITPRIVTNQKLKFQTTRSQSSPVFVEVIRKIQIDHRLQVSSQGHA